MVIVCLQQTYFKNKKTDKRDLNINLQLQINDFYKAQLHNSWFGLKSLQQYREDVGHHARDWTYLPKKKFLQNPTRRTSQVDGSVNDRLHGTYNSPNNKTDCSEKCMCLPRRAQDTLSRKSLTTNSKTHLRNLKLSYNFKAPSKNYKAHILVH
ncbi:hypothetical protein Cgig2_016607 [Carnegiea gigantea]|uniref:Uncharacterized protein n=1 Tax=Carnegiea gigantea TaxID=171969 RepID=A0A9Q1QSI7_9CARY|nr:hypothetical protein Cgig2_016607 [Carnegiea gigantea]